MLEQLRKKIQFVILAVIYQNIDLVITIFLQGFNVVPTSTQGYAASTIHHN